MKQILPFRCSSSGISADNTVNGVKNNLKNRKNVSNSKNHKPTIVIVYRECVCGTAFGISSLTDLQDYKCNPYVPLLCPTKDSLT